MPLPDHYVKALKDSPNVIGMAAFACLSLATLNPLPLLAGVVAEAAYLLFVPDTPWFKRRLARLSAAEAKAQRQALRDRILPTVRSLDQERYRVLEQTRDAIGSQEKPVMGDWYREVLHKLDYLLDEYLQFAAQAMQYRRYLVNLGETQARMAGRNLRIPGLPAGANTDTAREMFAREAPADALIASVVEFFDRQSDRCARDMEREKDAEVLGVMRKNAEVLRSSKESVQQIGRVLRSVENQLDLVANTFTLINTQIRTGSPEQIVADVEDVVNQSQALTQTMQEFRPVEEAMARLGRIG